MKAISVFDLRIIPQLAHLTHFDLIHPDNDCIVNPFLQVMGFDVRKGLNYTTSQHRTLQNKVEIGFVIRGEVNTSREHLTGPWADLQDRLTAAAITDPSLCRSMCAQLNSSLDFSSFGPDSSSGVVDFPASLSDPKEGEILAQIQQLDELLDMIRGSQHKEDGSLKRPEDYQTGPAFVKSKEYPRIKVKGGITPSLETARLVIKEHKEVLTALSGR